MQLTTVKDLREKCYTAMNDDLNSPIVIAHLGLMHTLFTLEDIYGLTVSRLFPLPDALQASGRQ